MGMARISVRSTDGALPTEEDQPAVTFLERRHLAAGAFQMDLGNVIDIAQVNSYSWHRRTPAARKCTASGPVMAPIPSSVPLPKLISIWRRHGWKLITVVDTRSKAR